MPPHPDLAARVREVVGECGGSQAEAARRLKTDRITVHRVLKTEARVTTAKRLALEAVLANIYESDAEPRTRPSPPLAYDDLTKHTPEIAQHVLRYLLEAVQDRQAHAKGDGL